MGDSNSHEVTLASPSSWCVYQFRQSRNLTFLQEEYLSIIKCPIMSTDNRAILLFYWSWSGLSWLRCLCLRSCLYRLSACWFPLLYRSVGFFLNCFGCSL